MMRDAEEMISSTSSGQHFLSLTNVSYQYNNKLVLENLSLKTSPGVTVILGPNGAGKSTLLKLASTEIPTQSGMLKICGHHVMTERSARSARRRIGYLPQTFRGIPEFTAIETVRYCAWLHGRSAHLSEIQDLVTALGLDSVAHRKIRTLSGGTLRRVGIATALAGKPDYILLDEPAAGLDPQQRISLRQILLQLQGPLVLVSTHLVEDAVVFADRIVIIKAGKMVFDGPSNVLQDMATAETLKFAGSHAEAGYLSIVDGIK
ncbi:Linearmycin resistance ATP-binding protein LnrL [Austwickia sp. TVS 96-490-7B]|uniref:ATP-binding cassette domain-containing protein n=1 Tax=Austwickia sp. TVS 96-490-7B TaxID=2830843 RepID=UPI001C55D7BF|nr:ATP-binding cassette domain-containing protein [Austwickia sp. TVS 96-490-7B]MBW3084095.1 Linearmycin resistance ATP-binding protein LnrL [Austwickia sp. TVS 96-490-7B]